MGPSQRRNHSVSNLIPAQTGHLRPEESQYVITKPGEKFQKNKPDDRMNHRFVNETSIPNGRVHDLHTTSRFNNPTNVKKPASVSIYDRIHSKFSTNNNSSTVVD